MSKLEKILVSFGIFLIASVSIFGIMVFRQQKAIKDLEIKISPQNNAFTKQPEGNASISKHTQGIDSVIRNFAGEVTGVSNKTLTIKVKLADFSKPKNPDKLKNTNGPVDLNQADFESMDKTVTINTSQQTVFTGKIQADLKTGDVVNVFADKSPYTSDVVTAQSVTYVPPAK